MPQRRRLLIDSYIESQKKPKKLSFWRKVWIVCFGSGGTITGQVEPRSQRPRTVERTQVPYPIKYWWR
jgi:hypothetical protein